MVRDIEVYRGLKIEKTGRTSSDYCVAFPHEPFFERRVRWGTIDEIRSDIDFYVDNGRPPPRVKGSWA
jgi:hypothetical protein